MSTTTGLQLRSRISKGGELELSLAEVTTPEPGPDQVVVRVEATPINPSDLGLLIGPADMSTAKASGSGAGIKVTAKVPEQALPFIAARLDQANALRLAALLVALARETGAAVVCATHDPIVIEQADDELALAAEPLAVG